LDRLEGCLKALNNFISEPQMVSEVILMIPVTEFLLRELLVSEDPVLVDIVNEVRPPVQGESLVWIFDDLRLRAQLWESYVPT